MTAHTHMDSPSQIVNPIPRRLCFVTVGATANFNALIRAVVSPAFLDALASHGYTDLLLQYGKDGDKLLTEALSADAVPEESEDDGVRVARGVRIAGFDFRKEGLGLQMLAARGTALGYLRDGVVVSHAGSGTILDALRLSVPLIVVPNPSLLDNHQDELAEELARQGYVVHGKLSPSGTGLEASIAESEKLRERHQQWPPVNSGENAKKKKRGLAGVMDEEMGFMGLD